jgi:hypothetical protein
MTALYWDRQDENKFSLFAGCSEVELATLTKRKKWWEAIIWMPDCYLKKRYGRLEDQMVSVEKIVQHFFDMANTDRPAMERPDTE